ncbi:MAG: hypothetical protein LLF89_08065 [Spirochaetaceae bacterium]|nr:hypothetical protein [Spirochaetaceae bacterium]
MKANRKMTGMRKLLPGLSSRAMFLLIFFVGAVLAAVATDDMALRNACISATIRALGLEIQHYEMQLNAAKNGPGNPANVPALEKNIAHCRDELEKYAVMNPSDYVIPESKEISVTVDQPYNYGDFLDLDGISKSGPFYHIAGIAGDEPSVLVPGKKYKLKVYFVLEKDYVLPFSSSWYVYVDSEGLASPQQTKAEAGKVEPTGLSLSPRQTGEEILEGLSTADKAFTIRVGSNGCTTKESFRVVVEPRPGIAVTGGVTGAAARSTPHYVITIYRVRVDECKAIVEEGMLITFDLEKDLGIKGLCTYSITNRIYSVAPFMP